MTYLEKRSAMAVFLPRVVTMDISLAVTLSDWDVHWLRLRLNGATEAIFALCVCVHVCVRGIDVLVSFPGTQVVVTLGDKKKKKRGLINKKKSSK